MAGETVWQSRMAANPLAGHFRRNLAGETHQRPCMAPNPACWPLSEEHGRRKRFGGHGWLPTPLSATFGETWPARCTSGHAWPPSRLSATFREAWPAKRFGSHEWPPTHLPATFSEPWPARRTSGHAWPPTPLVGHFPGSMAGETIWQSRMAGNPLVGHFQRTLAGETHQRPCMAATPLAGHFPRNMAGERFGGHEWPPTPFTGHFQRTLAGETPQRPCVAANPACRPLSKKHGRRDDLAVADGRQPPLPATFSEPWPARRFGDHAWPAARPRGDEETRRSGSCRDRRGRGGRDPQATMLLGSGRPI